MENEVKQVDIISSTDLRFVHGINYVTNSLIKCNVFFRNIVINRVCSYNLVVNANEGELLPIGSNIGTLSCSTKRLVRTTLRRMLSSDFFLFAYIKYFLNIVYPAMITIRKYLKDESSSSEFIIFQDVYAAYFYYKLSPSKKRKKTILILHCGENIYSQLSEVFPSLFNSSYVKKINKHYEFVYKSVDKVVYISQRAYDASCVPKIKKAFVYNGIQDFPFVNCMIKNKGKINFVSVGSINGHKGQEKIIEALCLLDDNIRSKIHFYFVGGGSLLSNLTNIAKANGLDEIVTFLGVRSDVDEILTNMDVFVLPSISEGLPMSIIEALSHGLYVLTTNTGGTPELIGEGWGEFITREPDNIKEKIITVINNNIVCESQKKKSRQHFENYFTLKIMAKQYEKILLSL